MKLIKSTWNAHQSKYERQYIANDESEITADFDPDSADGSTILCVSTGNVFIKNADSKWQKFGTTEVIS